MFTHRQLSPNLSGLISENFKSRFENIKQKIVSTSPDNKQSEKIDWLKTWVSIDLGADAKASPNYSIKQLVQAYQHIPDPIVDSAAFTKICEEKKIITNREKEDLKLIMHFCRLSIIQAASNSLTIEKTKSAAKEESRLKKIAKKLLYWVLFPAAFFISAAQGIDGVAAILAIIGMSIPAWSVLLVSIIGGLVASALYYVFEVMSLKEELGLDSNEGLKSVMAAYEKQAEATKMFENQLLNTSDDICTEDFEHYVELDQMFKQSMLNAKEKTSNYVEKPVVKVLRYGILGVGMILSMGEAAYLVSGVIVGFSLFSGPGALIVLGFLAIAAAIFFTAGYGEKIFAKLNGTARQVNATQKRVTDYCENNLVERVEKRFVKKKEADADKLEIKKTNAINAQLQQELKDYPTNMRVIETELAEKTIELRKTVGLLTETESALALTTKRLQELKRESKEKDQMIERQSDKFLALLRLQQKTSIEPSSPTESTCSNQELNESDEEALSTSSPSEDSTWPLQVSSFPGSFYSKKTLPKDRLSASSGNLSSIVYRR